jgi:hypothetical protein
LVLPTGYLTHNHAPPVANLRQLWLTLFVLCFPVPAWSQEAPAQQPQTHEHVDVRGVLLTPTRDATGTSWLPPETPMYGVHRQWKGWDMRLDGALFIQTVYEPGDRHRTGGADQLQTSATSWGMAMLRRNAGSGRVGLRAMVSADPWTASDCGTISFLATGEVCEKDTVHDRQQPHDLLMELAVDYERPLRGSWKWQLYAGLAGEPSLGPAAYPHRISAMLNPTAPISHHWLDGTMGVFGVVTGGVHNDRWKAEGSVFNGRAPDESRKDIDLGAFDSVAGRVTYLPTSRLAVQVSAARMHDAMSDFFSSNEDAVTRITASASYHRAPEGGDVWASTVGYGFSRGNENIAGTLFAITSDALLLESTFTHNQHTAFGRGEIVAMPAHHLHAHEFFDAVHTTAKMQAGYVFGFAQVRGWVAAVGGSAAVSILPGAYAPRYEGRFAKSLTAFFTLRPARHAM